MILLWCSGTLSVSYFLFVGLHQMAEHVSQVSCRHFYKRLYRYIPYCRRQTSQPMFLTEFVMRLHCCNVWHHIQKPGSYSSTVCECILLTLPVLNICAAHIPLFLYPFLNTTSKTRPFEYLRLTSLGVIGALVKVSGFNSTLPFALDVLVTAK
jgi:Cell differentiation family, Rcd1-like